MQKGGTSAHHIVFLFIMHQKQTENAQKHTSLTCPLQKAPPVEIATCTQEVACFFDQFDTSEGEKGWDPSSVNLDYIV